MLKKSVLLFAALAVVFASAGPVLALQVPVSVYVDTAYVGSEDGTQAKPYNTRNEAIYYAQNQPGGGTIFEKQPDGTWKAVLSVPYVHAGPTGTPLAWPVLFGILVAFSLVLVVAGLLLKRRSRDLAR